MQALILKQPYENASSRYIQDMSSFTIYLSLYNSLVLFIRFLFTNPLDCVKLVLFVECVISLIA